MHLTGWSPEKIQNLDREPSSNLTGRIRSPWPNLNMSRSPVSKRVVILAVGSITSWIMKAIQHKLPTSEISSGIMIDPNIDSHSLDRDRILTQS